MVLWFSHLIDKASEYFAARKGLLPALGLLLVLVNAVLQFIPGIAGFAHTNLFLHLGIILAIIGFMLASAL